jgi:hypothetical protein
MKHKVFDWLVLVVVLIGVVLTWQSGRERSRLSERHARLVRETGELDISDVTKLYVKALETEAPLEFAWRVYVPKNYNFTLTQRPDSGASVVTIDPSEYIARVRIRHDDSGMFRIYQHFGSGSQLVDGEDKPLAELLRGRWDELRVEQLGAHKVAVIGADEHAVLLRVTLPEELQRKAREKFSAEDLVRYVPVLFELDLGPTASVP